MDKLKALQYFIAAADAGSLSAAARQQGVTLQAVAKSLDTLEAELGVVLFQRGAKGLAFTADGAAYAETCRPLVAQLREAEAALREGHKQPQGTLVLGGTNFLMRHCLVAALPQFCARHPALTLDLRNVMHLDEPAAQDCDVLLLHGWYEAADWVRRELPLIPYGTLAAPAYWARAGMPQHPRDLQQHLCLIYRNPWGKLLDLWRYQQGNLVEEVVVAGPLNSNYRDHLQALALDGHGIVRSSLAVDREHLLSGRLVPALTDWQMLDLPPPALYFRPEQRRSPKVRAIVEFISAQIAQASAGLAMPDDRSTDRPEWHRSAALRASAWLRRPH